MHCAASLGHKTLCALLLHFGADPNIENFIKTGVEEDDEEDRENGQTVFDVAANDEVSCLLIRIDVAPALRLLLLLPSLLYKVRYLMFNVFFLQIRSILSASPEEWAKVYQSCSAIVTELKSGDSRDTNEATVVTADSIFLDSGINITDLNIS